MWPNADNVASKMIGWVSDSVYSVEISFIIVFGHESTLLAFCASQAQMFGNSALETA